MLGTQIVIEQIESTLRQSIQQLQAEMTSMQDRKENLDQDNEDLNIKIEKKFAELTRNRKRLQTLNAQRPVFMDELEKVEAEIITLYDTYVVNSRCLFFLEQKLEEFEEVEKMKIEVSENKVFFMILTQKFLQERNEEVKQMLEQMRADEFLKEGKDIKVNGGDEFVPLEDEEVDIPSDDGEGSDISDAMARDLELDKGRPNKPLGSIGPQTTTSNTKKLGLMGNGKLGLGVPGKKDRSLLAGTTTVLVNNKRQPRSSKTARIYSYGSLLADDDDDEDDIPEGGDDDEDDVESESQLSKSEEIAKMTDSEIDLDAIEDSDEDEDSENINLSDDFAPRMAAAGGRSKAVVKANNVNNNNNPSIPNAAKLTSKFSFDKSDDNF